MSERVPEGEAALPPAVRELIARRIDSIAELEALLLLFNEPHARWDAAAVARRLYVPEPQALEVLRRLAERGLASVDGGCWRFAPSAPAIGEAVGALAALYAQRLIAITALIHAKPARGIEEFARAFVLRRNE